MTAFWILAALFAAAAVGFVVPSLLRSRARAGAGTDETNVAIYRDQLKELDADLAAGTLGAREHEESRREIERRLLEDVRGATAPAAPRAGRGTAIALGIALPVLAVAVYLAVGNPKALVPGAAETSHGVSRDQIAGMVEHLAARLKQNPDDVEGWVMLGRSYLVLDRHAEAVSAYENAVKRAPDNAQVLADYANALAIAQGRSLAGEPERVIARALKLEPDNVKALVLAGTAAFEKKDYKGAIAHWERILKLVPPESEIADMVRDGIEDARKLAGLEKPAPSAKAGAPASISGTVRLSAEIAAKAAPDDTVFIFARAAEGPRMPVAIVRRRVRDLPVAFTLDDSTGMAAGMKLSDHPRVIIVARVSRSGSPAPQPGDLEGSAGPLANRSTGVVVEITREVR